MNQHTVYPQWITAINTLNNTPEMTRKVYTKEEDLEAREDYNKLFSGKHRIEYSETEPFLGW